VVELDGLKQSSIATINQFDISEEEQLGLLVSSCQLPNTLISYFGVVIKPLPTACLVCHWLDHFLAA